MILTGKLVGTDPRSHQRKRLRRPMYKIGVIGDRKVSRVQSRRAYGFPL